VQVSLILDALNRSRQAANPVPGLDTQHPVERLPVERRQYLVWGALAVALAVIAWLLMDRFSAPPAPSADIGAPVAELSSNIGSAVTSVTTELKARAAVPAPAPQAVVATPEPAVEVAAAPVEIPQVAAAAPNPQAQPVVVANTPVPAQDAGGATVEPATAVTVRAAENAAVARLYQNRDAEEESVTPAPASPAEVRPAQRKKPAAAADTSRVARAEESVDIDKILQQAREEVENASIDDHPVPFLSDLSQQTKDDIPTLYYQRHDYSSDTNLSSIVLNGTTFKAGESPLPGMKVEEILPDSVVLNYRGTQFRLRALNSWINL
jgi:general secretion pathway protein B